ncbi:alpha/beta fold hydrolase [Streptomyces xiamenensis]|uniref:thioesterase II family protein n=1 Tax=Streptomyces xiamenensis TaxID=408015 RepID=UPI0034289E33
MDAITPVGRAADWLPAGPPPQGALPLVCFPHAGAGASVFHAWEGRLPPGTVLCPVQPPGRESRFREPPLRDARAVVSAAADALIPVLREPFAVFGHSMGALLAYAFTRELRRRGAPLPVALFVSGRVAPEVRAPGPPVHELPAPDFLRFLHSLGGIPEHILTKPAFTEMMVPLLRADIAVNLTYAYREEPALPVPLTAFAGALDSNVPVRWVRPWAGHTSASFALRVVPGGHFFPYEDPASVLGPIGAALEEVR